MKSAIRIAALGSLSLFVVSCATKTSSPIAGTSYGPFDSHGNYVEAWADNPSKWKGGNTAPLQMPDPSPQIEAPTAAPTGAMLAKNDIAPPDSIPVNTVPTAVAKVRKDVEEAPKIRKIASEKSKLASNDKSARKNITEESTKLRSRKAELSKAQLAANDRYDRNEAERKSARKHITEESTKLRSRKSELSKAQLAANDRYDRNEAERRSARKSAESSTDKGLARKAAVSKNLAKSIKAKAEPQVYIVKKGDTLSKIASKSNTTVAALQKKNKIKGSVIQPGKKLLLAKN